MLKNNLIIKELVTIKSSFSLSGKMNKVELDHLGDRIDWPTNEKRGGEKYDAPKGWIGIGLKAFDKYENDRWIDMENLPGEWVVAYHGIGQGLPAEMINGITHSIINSGFKIGNRQVHKDCEDYYHKGRKVGEGIYCTPYIGIAEQFAGKSIIKGKKYKTIIMVRINPKARRHCYTCDDSRKNEYWVVNPSTDEIRPYRILYKRSEDTNNNNELIYYSSNFH